MALPLLSFRNLGRKTQCTYDELKINRGNEQYAMIYQVTRFNVTLLGHGAFSISSRSKASKMYFITTTLNATFLEHTYIAMHSDIHINIKYIHLLFLEAGSLKLQLLSWCGPGNDFKRG